MITTEATISMTKRISNTFALFEIVPNKLVNWIPGMFLQLSLEIKTASEPWLDSKPFTIASWGGRNLKILVRKEGKFTSRLFEKSEETSDVSIKYPMGNFLLKEGREKCFIAGGSGISAFTSYIDYANSSNLRNSDIIFHSAKLKEELVTDFYWDEIPPEMKVYTRVTSDGVKGERGLRLSLNDVSEVSQNKMDLVYYVCGPPGFTSYWENEFIKNNLEYRIEKWKKT